MKPKVNTLVLIYNSFNDPLFQNLVFSYIKTLTGKVNGEFHIVTFEQFRYHIPYAEREEIRRELSSIDIYWHPLDFHTGRFLILKKLWDFVQALYLVFKIKIKHRTNVIFSFANVSAAIGIVLKRLFRLKMIVYSYEPHSEFMADLGFWNKSGFKFKILHYLEHMAGQQAEFIMTGTQHMVNRLRNEGSNAKLYRAPTAVDPENFYFRKQGRSIIRDKYGIQNKKVILYLGKFGGLYYTKQIPQMCAVIKSNIPEAFFLVVTSNDFNEIESMYSECLEEHDYLITGHLTYDEVKDYISASDVGISGVPPSPSQKYRSPTKVAEYLMCGIPYITTSGVAEDDVYANTEGVGVVIEEFGIDISEDVINELRGLFNQDVSALRDNCRNVGLEYRSKSRIDNYLKEIYDLLK